MKEFRFINTAVVSRDTPPDHSRADTSYPIPRVPAEVALIAVLLLAWGSYELVSITGEVLAYFIPANDRAISQLSMSAGRGPLIGGLHFIMSLCQVALAIALFRQATWARKATIQYLMVIMLYKVLRLVASWGGMFAPEPPIIIGMNDVFTRSLLGLLDMVKYASMIFFLGRAHNARQSQLLDATPDTK